MAPQQFPAIDKNGVELAIGDTVRGVTANSNGEEVSGTVDEIRLTNPLNLRVQVGEIQRNDRGDEVGGYHYVSSDYVVKEEPKKRTSTSPSVESSTPARKK